MYAFLKRKRRRQHIMHWDAIIDRQHGALLRLITVMFSVLSIEAGGSVDVVPLHVRLMVMRILRPAESALRRLVFMRARDLPDEEYVCGPAREKSKKRGKRGASHSRSVPLFDPRKKPGQKRRRRPSGPGPRIFFLDDTDPPYTPEPEAEKPQADDLVSAAALCQRLNALAKALGDLDGQARRLKRLQARRKLVPKLRLQGVLRINTPPGHREKGRSENERAVDEILRECQIVARRWIKANDTS